MIHAKDWIVFLENGIPLEELPIPEEHLPYCLSWLNNQKIIAEEVVFNFSEYPPCVFHRVDIWNGY